MPIYVEFDLGAVATYTAACANIILASGIPILVTASKALLAITNAIGSAFPTSSDA